VGVKQDASYFENKEPVLIYIGKKLRDAVRLEEIFTAANVDYGVEADGPCAPERSSMCCPNPWQPRTK
jgi:hypothetical protein